MSILRWPDRRGLDWWSVCHFAAGLLIACAGVWYSDLRWSLRELIPTSLLASGLWEIVEYRRETRRGGGREPWLNRLVTDPIVNTAGAISGWALMRYVLA